MGRINRTEDWDVGRELAELQREMNRLARRNVRPAPRRGTRAFPSLIISRQGEELVVRAEVPGMNLEDFEISVSGDSLTIQGVRVTGQDLDNGWYHRRERERGSFSRAVRLPEAVDGQRAAASYEAGVLTINLPLREEAKPRQIPIQVAEG